MPDASKRRTCAAPFRCFRMRRRCWDCIRPRRLPPPHLTVSCLMTPMLDLLRSFLSSKERWNDSERLLAAKIHRLLEPSSTVEYLRKDPSFLMEFAGMQPDPWQRRLLRSDSRRSLLLCCRQAGKTTAAAALALRVALLEAPALILLMSPTQRQSGELFRDKIVRLHNAIGRPLDVAQETALTMVLGNGSRIMSLPGDEKNIRGFSGVKLLVVDEAARVDDSLYFSIRPMLAVSGGRLVCLSTPFGQRGWFHDAWNSGENWDRYRVVAEDCPRISADFLEEERRVLGDRWYAQEYGCSFEEALGAVFAHADILAAMTSNEPPLILE